MLVRLKPSFALLKKLIVESKLKMGIIFRQMSFVIFKSHA